MNGISLSMQTRYAFETKQSCKSLDKIRKRGVKLYILLPLKNKSVFAVINTFNISSVYYGEQNDS